MGRIRTIKPEIAKHGDLFDAERETGLPLRFAWAVLPTACDREGRFKWKPRDLKCDVLPHDELDFSRVLDAFLTRGMLVKYRVGNEWFGLIPTFKKHQVVNVRETASILPSHEDADETYQQLADASATREPRDDDAACGEGKGKEGKGREGNNNAAAPSAGIGVPRGTKQRPPAKPAFVLPDWIDASRWDAFEEMRRRMRKPLTDRARELIVGELEKLRAKGYDSGDLLDASTRKNWLDVYEPKPEDRRRARDEAPSISAADAFPSEDEPHAEH